MKSTDVYAKEIHDRWGLVLTSEYLGAHAKVIFSCVNNHTNEGTATNVLQRGYKCKECITGYKVTSKIDWTEELTSQLLELLETNPTEVVARTLGTTVSAINNKLAELEVSNPRCRLSRGILEKVLHTQGRVLNNLGEISAKQLVSITCSNGHVITQQASNIISHNTGCPSCYSAEGSSNQEKELVAFIRSIYSGWIELNDRKILKGRELDIMLPDLGIAIEYNGTYWHNEDKVGKYYHKSKSDDVEALEFQLIHIKDYDWVTKQEIVKSIIRSKLNITTKIHARKCQLRKISFPKEFLEANHIQGAGQPTSNNLGLFHLGTLVAVATFAAPRYDTSQELELIRFCSLLNTTVVGGLSKLLNKIPQSLVSYASRDYSVGKGYLSTGFEYVKTTEPGLEFYKKNLKVSRYKAQSMTKEELSGFTKYYNAGNLVFYRKSRQP